MGDKQEGAVNLAINFTPVAQPQGQEAVQQPIPVAQPVQQQQTRNYSLVNHSNSIFSS